MKNEKLRFENGDDFIELSVAGREFDGDDWLNIDGSWQIGGKTMCGQDAAAEIGELKYMKKFVEEAIADRSIELDVGFMEPNLAFYCAPDGPNATLEIYFLPEHTIWQTHERADAEKIIHGNNPTFVKPYEQGDLEKINAWLDSVLECYK